MAYRSYPDVDRAMNQLVRHYPEPPAEVLEMPECLRPMVDSFDRLRVNARRAAGQGFGVGEYHISAFPRIVSAAP